MNTPYWGRFQFVFEAPTCTVGRWTEFGRPWRICAAWARRWSLPPTTPCGREPTYQGSSLPAHVQIFALVCVRYIYIHIFLVPPKCPKRPHFSHLKHQHQALVSSRLTIWSPNRKSHDLCMHEFAFELGLEQKLLNSIARALAERWGNSSLSPNQSF